MVFPHQGCHDQHQHRQHDVRIEDNQIGAPGIRKNASRPQAQQCDDDEHSQQGTDSEIQPDRRR